MAVIRHHESLAMVGFDEDELKQPLAKGDKNTLPLGALWATNAPPAAMSKASSSTTTKPANSSIGQQPELPDCPAGQPILVLFPETLHLAVFLVQPPPALLASGSLVAAALAGSVLKGWGGIVSPAGGVAGLLAGVAAGLGVRSRPVVGWSCEALSCLGIALQGGGRPSLNLAFALGVSRLWRHGWWLFLSPQVAPLVFFACGVTMDVAFGFLLASMFQVHYKPPQSSPAAPSASGDPQLQARAPGNGSGSGVGGRTWAAVTPPSLASRAGTGRRI